MLLNWAINNFWRAYRVCLIVPITLLKRKNFYTYDTNIGVVRRIADLVLKNVFSEYSTIVQYAEHIKEKTI